MAWRVASSLITLRDQINTFAPTRNKASDGTIGDAAHAASTSDHNPWIRDAGLGVVSALDITHDPRKGVDTWLLGEVLRQRRDGRIKYVISNRRIWSATVSPFTWRNYTGSNPHSSHIHVSVKSTKAHYDDARAWDLGNWAPGGGELPSALRPILRAGSRGDFVRELQTALDITSDGVFGPETERHVKLFQSAKSLTPDGVVGPMTWQALDATENPGAQDPDSAATRPILRRGSYGEPVRQIQRILMLSVVDGAFGAETEREVLAFQAKYYLKQDGIVGPQTWAALDTIEQLPRPFNFDEPMELSEPIMEIPRLPDRSDAPTRGDEDDAITGPYDDM